MKNPTSPHLNISSLLRTNERHNHQKTWRSMSFAPPPNLPGQNRSADEDCSYIRCYLWFSSSKKGTTRPDISHPSNSPKGFMNLDLLKTLGKSKNVLPHGGKKWWFTNGTIRKKILQTQKIQVERSNKRLVSPQFLGLWFPFQMAELHGFKKNGGWS